MKIGNWFWWERFPLNHVSSSCSFLPELFLACSVFVLMPVMNIWQMIMFVLLLRVFMIMGVGARL